MLEQLELLLELQGVDSELFELTRERESLPGRIESLAAVRERVRSESAEKESALEDAKKERLRKERELEDVGAKVADLKSKQLVIKTNEEYAALTHEIEFRQREISDTEDAILRLLEDIERLTTEVEEARAAADEATAQMDREIAELRSKLEELDDAIAVKRDERLRIAMRVDGSVLRRYEGILHSKGDSALARIVDGACSGCYKNLPPQTVIEVKRGNGFVECDGCGRILYWSRETELG